MCNKTVLPSLGSAGGAPGGGGVLGVREGRGMMPRQPESEKDGLRETHSANIFFAHKIEPHNL